MSHPTDSELTAMRIVLPSDLSVERGAGVVLVTLHASRRADPLVTWSLAPRGDAPLGGPRATAWVEYLGGTAETVMREIGGDVDADPDERIEQIPTVTASSAQRFGDDFRVAVHKVHTDDPDDWF